MPRLLIAALALLLAPLLASCAAQRAPATPTAAERQLLDQLTRDPFVIVETVAREDDGFLTVRTRQGSTFASYRFMPADDAREALVIRRIDERQELPVGWTPEVGTGPAPRGLPWGR